MYRYKYLLLILFVILAGCSLLSEEQVLKNAEESAEAVFKDKPVETNQTIDDVTLYLPEELEIKGSSDNNVVLESKGGTYLLFYSQFENEMSQLLYQEVEKEENHLLLKSFQENDRFGYISVLPYKTEDMYDLQVGIGGVKLKTLTNKADLEEEAEKMMRIVRSVVLNESNT
ncbi:hypothetical protein [Salirhabdus salicampi]|uniref:hypothetical protein n=1 Tax=Salirhabdus salicampi TaxID=476102 RepID=UPI0020C274C7|nr:hypothetical protein [Salirhabdus salicampi]MCP8617155.1 hypothetical protein [Salirhabdus salicampi]